MTGWQLVALAAALTAGCALQGAVGFGTGLLSIPLMVWAGVELPYAIAVTLAAVVTQTGWNLYRYRDHFKFRDTVPLQCWRLVTLPVGVAALGVLVSFGQDRIKQVIGGLLLLVLIAQWALKVEPRERVGAGWTALAGSVSGFMAGLVGMGGPPIVLWVMAHDWPGKTSRAFLWAIFLPLSPIGLALLAYKFHGESDIWGATLLGLALTPLVIAGAEVGARLGALMSRDRLRQAALGLLLLLALASLAAPLLP